MTTPEHAAQTSRGTQAARAAADHAARAAYGRLVSLVAAPTRDIALAEDVLGDAFERALRTWPDQGVPDNPEAWLLTVARNRQRDVLGSATRRTSQPLTPEHEPTAVGDLEALAERVEAIPDARLGLLFACAHPAIEPGVRTPLMLQAVLGLDAASIARLYAVPTATMAQRLVRAKRRIRHAGIPLRVPPRTVMAERLPPVLEAIYGAWAAAWDGVAGAAEPALRDSLADEARWLAVLVATMLDDEPEAWGLAALLTLSLARTPARSSDGYVPLEDQDPALWDRDLLDEGEGLLRRALRGGRPLGRFQLEAAIQSAHGDRRRSGEVDREVVRRLYLGLVSVAPTLGARVALAAATARVDGPDAGLAVLNAMGPGDVEAFAPAWATRAALLAEVGRLDAAAAAYARAAELTVDPSVRSWLMQRHEAMRAAGGP